jgi:hypothetical protein
LTLTVFFAWCYFSLRSSRAAQAASIDAFLLPEVDDDVEVGLYQPAPAKQPQSGATQAEIDESLCDFVMKTHRGKSCSKQLSCTVCGEERAVIFPDEIESCSICLSDLEDTVSGRADDGVRMLPDCGHRTFFWSTCAQGTNIPRSSPRLASLLTRLARCSVFHTQCIDGWLRRTKRCPLCCGPGWA